MKQTISTMIAVIIIVGLTSIIIIDSKNKSDIKTPIFFYGNTCLHCKDTEEWMKKNKIEEKIKIIKKEVYNNRENAQELVQTAKKCGLPTDSIGVPFLYAEEKCLIGTPDIISFLSSKTGVSEKKFK